MNRAAVIALAAALLIGCASPTRGDWKYSEVAAAVDSYRSGKSAAAAVPQRIRSIRVDGADALTVYLSDSPGLKGRGCELKLARGPSGAWVVTGARFFEY